MTLTAEQTNAIEDKANEILTEIRDTYDLDVPNAERLVSRLTGRRGGLRPSKPTATNDDGFIQYVWRMVRFHSGKDMTMPVTASWDLQDWLENQGRAEIKVAFLLKEGGKELTTEIDKVVDLITVLLGENPYKAARAWGRAMYGE